MSLNVMDKQKRLSQLQLWGLGLKRGTVSISPYSPGWPAAFSYLSDLLRSLGGHIHIHHIGSTAVENLFAKPILDILITFPEGSSFLDETRAIEALGFKAKGDYGIPGRHFFTFYDLCEETDFVHIHGYAEDNSNIMEHLAFRDALRFSSKLRTQYESLKKDLIHSGVSRKEYPGAKTDFVIQVLNGSKAKL